MSQEPQGYQGPQGPQVPTPPAAEAPTTAGSIFGALARGILGKVIGAVVVVVLVGAGIFIYSAVTKKTGPQVGECVQVTGSTNDPDMSKLDCGDAQATYVINGINEACDEEAETEYSINGGRSGQSTLIRYCLGLNAQKGDCFDLGNMSTPTTKVACSQKGSQIVKITLVADKTTDVKKCPKGSEGLANAKRGNLICLAENG